MDTTMETLAAQYQEHAAFSEEFYESAIREATRQVIGRGFLYNLCP